MIRNIVYAAIALGGMTVGAVAVQAVDGAQVSTLTAKVSILSQAASRCDADEQTRRDVVNGMQQFAKPYTGPEL